MSFKQRLIEMDACEDAVQWVGRKGLKRCWNTCERGDWMLWLTVRLKMEHRLIVLAACDCAEPALQYLPKNEKKPAEAIRVAREWCIGQATLAQVKNAAAAAYATAAADAAYAAAAAAAADAAYTAVAAVAYAAAADAAAAAAYAPGLPDVAAYSKSLKQSADLIRKRIPFETIEQAYNDTFHFT